MITLDDVRKNDNFRLMIHKANAYLAARGYTEHGPRHVNYVAKTTAYILETLGYDERQVNLGAVAGYLHDIGNMHNRKFHGPTGANIVFCELRLLGVPLEDIVEITTAIANHEEETGLPVSPISAALILADKSDAHRTRARRKKPNPDIHDRVNLAITDSALTVDPNERTITLDLTFDTQQCQVMDFFEIYLSRMEMSKKAAEMLNCRFRLVINGLEMLGKTGPAERPIKVAGA
ncbi:MAG: HD domain-containing protein [Limnochordia bacterium]|jgi:metal-dependent HD superfamily phosphatase/phosphodiesterase|nr:HD domain-containing protein [Bacillota bacterium]